MISQPLLSIVIPAYNEEQRIAGTLDTIFEYLKAQSFAAEIIVVDDGSTDQTVELCRSYTDQHPNLRTLKLPKNRGKGCAVRTGMLDAKGDYVLMSDADLATPIEELDAFWPWMHQDFDIVIASRALPNSSLVIHQPFHREVLGRCFNLVVQALAVPGVKDTQCGFKLFTKKASDAVFRICKSDGYSFDIEALYVARRMKLKIKEAPVHWKHIDGSKVSVLKDGLATLADITAIRLRHIRIR